jgi:hypothetical protein
MAFDLPNHPHHVLENALANYKKWTCGYPVAAVFSGWAN